MVYLVSYFAYLGIFFTAMATENIKDFFDILESIAVIAASIAAIMGFNKWEKEITGKRRMELAKEAIRIFSRFPTVIQEIRKYWSMENEGSSMLQNGEEITVGHICLERIRNQSQYFDQIDALEPMFSACFGKDKSSYFEEAKNLALRIRNAAFAIVLSSYASGRQRTDNDEELVCDTSREGDEIYLQTAEIKEKFLSLCYPYFKN